MWESIGNVFTSSNGIGIAMIMMILIIMIMFLAIKLTKTGFLKIKTNHIKLGNHFSERELIRRQIETAYGFIMSIEGKISCNTSEYNGYFTKYILEKIYDKVVEWIMFNHITVNQLYIQDKQDTVLNMIYSLPINDEFKTPEFKGRVEQWTKELIEQLVNVKTLYGNLD